MDYSGSLAEEIRKRRELQLKTNPALVDKATVEILRDWIKQLKLVTKYAEQVKAAKSRREHPLTPRQFIREYLSRLK